MDVLLPLEESDERSMLEDLQLAAELGKTLLERNKELEGCIKQQSSIIEDQAQEIEYLTKQTAALREVNDSRLRIYEQLEVSIQDLERANQRLVLESASDKKHIKSLCVTIDSLEARCDELQAAVQQLQGRHCDKQDQAVQHRCPDVPQVSDGDQLSNLQSQLHDLRQQRTHDRGKLAELEEQLSAAVQENSYLEDQVAVLRLQHEQVPTGEGLRQGYLCSRCLKKTTFEDDTVSVASSDAQRSTLMQHTWDSQDEDASVDVAYQTLVEKYEALLKMQQGSPVKPGSSAVVGDNCMSLQDELRLSGDYATLNGKPEGSCAKMCSYSKNKVHKAFSGTPTEFSEAETCSSGFSDDTSSKGTQTDSYLPGYFLCSVADGDDCRISIYDDINPVESRFRKTPEYKQLFREIFAVLKRAAEEKTECEQAAAAAAATQVAVEAPPVPQADDAHQHRQIGQTDADCSRVVSTISDAPKPKHDILEYLKATSSGHKKSRSRKNSPAKKVERMEAMAAVGSCVARLQANGNRQGGRRRRDTRVFENQTLARDKSFQKVESWDFQPQPFVSAASQEVAKLRRLEKSYAEVLRLGPKKAIPRSPFPSGYHC